MEIATLPELNLEYGGQLNSVHLAFHTYGHYIPAKTPVVWVCHALTANSNVFEWWKGLFGEYELFNPKDYFIICVNNLGSCYGSTGPLNINPKTNLPYYRNFPLITIRDIVRSFIELRKKLCIDKIDYLIGGSQGGQIALEWSILEPEVIQNLILIATNAKHSAWGIAFNESQRLAIFADPTYYNDTPDGGQNGLKAARSIALLSYRNYASYVHFQSDFSSTDFTKRKAITYQQYQGEKLIKRFNAYSYVTLSYAMDSHDVFRNRNESVLQTIKARTLVVGIKSDILFPIEEQLFLTSNIKNSKLEIFDSIYGHDGFLTETQKLSKIIYNFNQSNLNKKIYFYEKT